MGPCIAEKIDAHKVSFLQTHKIANNDNIGIIGFTTWKNTPATKCYHSEHWT